jgi:quercetin dioxygenase-like cupin family protein
MDGSFIDKSGYEVDDLHIRADAGGWVSPTPGIEARVLRTCQATGTFVVLYKVKAGTTAQRHVHYGSAESYLISGKMEVRGGAENGGKTVLPGDYGFEANGARHDATYFPEDTLLFYINHGPIAYLDENGKVDYLLDFDAMRKLAADPAAQV